METYRVTARMGVTVPAGTAMKLSKAQAAKRGHLIDDGEGRGVSVATGPLTFKQGEEITLDATNLNKAALEKMADPKTGAPATAKKAKKGGGKKGGGKKGGGKKGSARPAPARDAAPEAGGPAKPEGVNDGAEADGADPAGVAPGLDGGAALGADAGVDDDDLNPGA